MDKPADDSIGEFFAMHKHRRCVVGRLTAKRLLDRDLGRWQAGFHVMHKHRRCGAGRLTAKRLLDRDLGRWQADLHPRSMTSVRL